MWQHYAAGIAVIWCIVLITVIIIGTIQIWRYFSRPILQPISSTLPLARVPHITIIRPIVGLEPYLNECLASIFTQNYPAEKLTISFCIASRDDVALPVLEKLVAEHTQFDARIYIESEDPILQQGERNASTAAAAAGLGPNPKIRNMSRAYREAKGDIIWIADCNVWLHEATAGMMVDLLCGYSRQKDTSLQTSTSKYAFVHQLPLAVDVSHLPPSAESVRDGAAAGMINPGGGLLEEMFMSTAHVKFYTAISTVGIAPCTVGKSNMFRRSHLDALTQPIDPTSRRSPGIDFFSDNICEDHLIGDLLWKTRVPDAVLAAAAIREQPSSEATIPASSTQQWRKHALLLNPPCLQPQYRTRVSSYIARRIRWLRVRKFTVPAATFVEPATESLLASTIITWILVRQFSLPESQLVSGGIWLTCILLWLAIDRFVWRLLQNWLADARDLKTRPPVFVAAARNRAWTQWVAAWFGREVLALPVWIWAVLGGTQVVWRGRRFWVGFDMKVHEVDSKADGEGKKKL